MSNISMHPPADRRCQIYTERTPSDLVRCANPGTHWVAWGGCQCEDPVEDVCEDAYFSWECDAHGPYDVEEAA